MRSFLLVLALAACDPPVDNSDFAVPLDMRAPKSACGAPGDVGNQFGVGLFCFEDKECADNLRAQTCTATKNDFTAPRANDSYFCTFNCTADAGTNECGIGARCVCQAVDCNCIPRTCSVPDGGFHF